MIHLLKTENAKATNAAELNEQDNENTVTQNEYKHNQSKIDTIKNQHKSYRDKS